MGSAGKHSGCLCMAPTYTIAEARMVVHSLTCLYAYSFPLTVRRSMMKSASTHNFCLCERPVIRGYHT
jgi:hypothetical protein